MVPVSSSSVRMTGFHENKFVSSLKIDPLLRSYQVSQSGSSAMEVFMDAQCSLFQANLNNL